MVWYVQQSKKARISKTVDSSLPGPSDSDVACLKIFVSAGEWAACVKKSHWPFALDTLSNQFASAWITLSINIDYEYFY